MRIVFLGSPHFAVPSLEILCEHGYEIVAVITGADKLGGRGKKKVMQTAIKKYAVSKGLTVLQPRNLKNPEFVEGLRSFQADLQVIVAFRMLPEVVWDMPPLGTINLHASLLPSYRGAAPINWAIINGERQTGLTTFKLKHEIDTGNVLYTRKVEIEPNETAGQLHDKMMDIGAQLVLKSVQAIENGTASYKPQDPSAVSKAPKIFHDTCEIDFNRPTVQVHNFIRGLSPYPCAWTKVDGKQLNIYRAIPYDTDIDARPGKILKTNKKTLLLGCADGWISLKEVQLQGRKKMSVVDFLNGNVLYSAYLDSYSEEN